jgi:hypothetical protein
LTKVQREKVVSFGVCIKQHRTRDKTAVFSTRKKPGEKKNYFFFIKQIVIVVSEDLLHHTF